MRTIIELPAAQLEALDAICEREGISRAEGVRRSVAQYVQQQRASTPDKAFGLWRGRGVDGLTYEAHLRREWDTAAPARTTRAPGTAKRR
jgi:hypothetical protein